MVASVILTVTVGAISGNYNRVPIPVSTIHFHKRDRTELFPQVKHTDKDALR